MIINKILKISVFILFAFVFTDIGLRSYCNPPVITSPSEYDIFIARKAYTDLFEATGDAVISWSGSGTFDQTTGSPVSWTAPGTTGNVTITATNSYGSDQIIVKTTNIIYVDEDATGNDDGTSWTDAFDTLQEGLNAASSGNHIWVAEGTYKPGTLKLDTFHLVPGVETYGGFDPTVGDDLWAERDYINNVAILSGDIDDDDTLDSGNSYFVVTANDVTIDGSTRLDGFTITMGWSYHYLCDGAGMKIENCDPNVANCIFKENMAPGGDGDGGGMGCYNASPEVTNCLFIDNVAGDDGGALVNTYGSNGTFTNCVFYNNETLGDNDGKSNGGAIWNTASEKAVPIGSSPTFINCVIANNSTTNDGGGAANSGADTDPTYINCIFYSNSAGDDGGGMATKEGSDTTVTNCVFANNSSVYDGGGAFNAEASTNPTYLNCTFYSNSASDDGGGIAVKDGSNTTVTNCILWDDQANDNGNEIFVSDSTITVSYSDVEGGYSGTGNINSNPDFVDSSDPDGADNEFITDDDGLRLVGWRRSFSPCIDSGNNTPVTESYDIIGKTRIVDGNNDTTATVDMGAYEFTNTDTDSDKMPDWWEVTYGLDPTDSTGSNGADGDGDSDNWRNIVEYLLRTEPDNGSSDGVDRMPTGWTTMEIEAKWIISQSTFNSLRSNFPDNGTYSGSGTTYDLNWKWGGGQQMYWDLYYDNATDDISDDLHCLRHRRRYDPPYRDPDDRDRQKVQYKSDPFRFGGVWLRQECEDDPFNNILPDDEVQDIVGGDPDTWENNPLSYLTVNAVKSDHPGFDESTLDDFLEVVDYRYKIDFEINGDEKYTMSLDDVTSTYSGESPVEFYEAELEIIPMPHNAAQVEELFRILVELEADYSLTPSTTSKGGMEVPESF